MEYPKGLMPASSSNEKNQEKRIIAYNGNSKSDA
jgi:hypothetical protein